MKFDKIKWKKAINEELNKLGLQEPIVYNIQEFYEKVIFSTNQLLVKDYFSEEDIDNSLLSHSPAPKKYVFEIKRQFINNQLMNKEYSYLATELIHNYFSLIVEITSNLFDNNIFKNFVHPAHHNDKHFNFETISINSKDFLNVFFKKRSEKNGLEEGILFMNKTYYKDIKPTASIFTNKLPPNNYLYVNDLPSTNEQIIINETKQLLRIFVSFDYNFAFIKEHGLAEKYVVTNEASK